MAKVQTVGPAMLARTTKWLVGQQAGDGSWAGDQSKFCTFKTSVARNTAFVVWAAGVVGVAGAGAGALPCLRQAEPRCRRRRDQHGERRVPARDRGQCASNGGAERSVHRPGGGQLAATRAPGSARAHAGQRRRGSRRLRLRGRRHRRRHRLLGHRRDPDQFLQPGQRWRRGDDRARRAGAAHRRRPTRIWWTRASRS